MNKRTIISLFGLFFIALPVLAMSESHSYKFVKAVDFDKCSEEVEGLKLCVENSKATVSSGEEAQIKLVWINRSDANRRISNRRSGYSVTVITEHGKKLVPVFEQRFIEEQKRVQNTGEEDRGTIVRVQRGGSDRGMYVEAGGIEKDEIRLTDEKYDYDLSTKGKYFVRLEKTMANLEGNKQITFVIDSIEIQVN